jgi:hypothetical protein
LGFPTYSEIVRQNGLEPFGWHTIIPNETAVSTGTIWGYFSTGELYRALVLT